MTPLLSQDGKANRSERCAGIGGTRRVPIVTRQHPAGGIPKLDEPPVHSTSIANHARQLEAIASLRIASREPNAALDEIAVATARIFDVPSILINVGLEESEWYQGQYGLPPGFIISKDAPTAFAVSDADSIHRTLSFPEVIEDTALCRTEIADSLGARFYAGIPLVTVEGKAAGTLCILDSQPRKFTDTDMEILHALGSRALDEIELRAARDRAERDRQHADERSREKAELVAVTAHELKNPLTIIKGISTMLAADPKFPLAMRTEFMQTISRQVDRMLRIIDETLDLASLETGGDIHLTLQEIDLGERLINVANFYDAASPRHQVTTQLARGSHAIFADRDKLDQVLFNIVGNAVKYSPDGGKVSIRSELRADLVHITIIDDGLGMTAEQVSRLFGRFVRHHAQTAPQIKGTGLGLYLAKHLVDAHLGRLWVESQPGAGSRFHLELPLAQKSESVRE